MHRTRQNDPSSSPRSNQSFDTSAFGATNNETEQERPRKRTRCLRSCLNCRKAKQRCQLPDSFAEPSNSPLPSHLACRRCLVLESDCFVVDGVPRASTSNLRSQNHARLSLHSSTVSDPLIKNGTSQDQLVVVGRGVEEDNRISVGRSSGTPPPVNDLRLFDPEGGDLEKANIRAREEQSSSDSTSALRQPRTTKDWIKVGTTVCRPFELLGYLLRKQSISRHLFSQSSRPGILLMNLIYSIPDLQERYEEEVESLQTSLPFLPSFEELRQAGKDADLFLGVILYLSFKTRQEGELQSKILPILRQHCLSCIIHQPRNIYDITSLVLTTLHLPLLLGPLSDGNSLDGAGLLTSAASASLSFDLDKSFPRLHSAAIPDINDKELQSACLYMSLALHTGFVALAGDVERQPIVKCSPEDCNTLHYYVSAICASPQSSRQIQRKCASVLLLIYRARATDQIREVCHKYASLMKIHREDIDRASNIASFQVLFNESKGALQCCCDTLKQYQHPLAKDLASFGWQPNFCIDVFSLDMALLQFVCLSRFTEKLFERSPRLIGHDASPTDLLTLLNVDRPLQTLYSSVGCHRADIARHVLALLMNTLRHASIQGNQRGDIAPPLLLVQSIATTHLCSSLVMAGQAITEELDGRITAGQSPYKKIGDATMEIAEVLLQGTMQALLQLGELSDASNAIVRQAAHQGNLFVLSARLIDSLARRLIGWKGHRTTSTRSSMSFADDRGDKIGEEDPHFDLESVSPDNFEDLFREILSTPIEFI